MPSPRKNHSAETVRLLTEILAELRKLTATAEKPAPKPKPIDVGRPTVEEWNQRWLKRQLSQPRRSIDDQEPSF